jgi:type III pantothenate kinase
LKPTLTIDAGNSHLTLALYRGGRLCKTHRIHTRPFQTATQLAGTWRAILTEAELRADEAHLCISSVVPDYHVVLKEAGELMGTSSFHWVSTDSPHGFAMQDSVRREIGADLIAGLVGARGKTSGAVVVVDAGTATTLTLLSAQDRILGVAILPGIKTQIKMLMEKAPHLADSVQVEIPAQPFGTNTVESIQSGIMYGHAQMIEGFVQRYRSIPGFESCTVFGCGGLFTTIAPLCLGVTRAEAHLVNDGCLILSQRQGKEGV